MSLNYYNPLEKVNTFISPNKVMLGVGVLENSLGELKKFNKEKVLLITDKIVSETETVKNYISVLSSNGFSVELFLSETEEPTVEMAKSFSDFVRKKKEGIVMGIGGGSIMDQAKIASFMATNEGEIEDYIGPDKINNEGLPLILIPTTAGTGAETSRNAVLKSGHKKLVVSSPKILPDIAILDPLLTISLPPRPTAFTGMDALTHALEGIMSIDCNSLVMANALEAISLINKSLEVAYYSGYDIQARYDMLLAATLGGFALNGGALLAHSISYTLGVPHGVGCAIALPQVIRFNAPVIPAKMKKIARAFELNDERIDYPEETASYVVNKVDRLNYLFNIPQSLKSMDIKHEKVAELAEECFTKFPRPNNPRAYSKDDIVKLYEDLWSGNLEIS